jgi:endo-1,4-beta-mannosidase
MCSVQLYFKYDSAEICRRKFWCQFTKEPVPSKQSIQYLLNKLKPTVLLIRQEGRHEQTVVTEEKFDHMVLDLKLHQGNILND